MPQKRSKSKLAKKPVDNGMPTELICATHGGKSYSIKNGSFYKAGEGSIYAGIGHIPICKDCMTNTYLLYLKKYKSVKVALFYTCRKYDIAFNLGMYEAAEKQNKHDNRDEQGTEMFSMYMSKYNSLYLRREPLANFEMSDDVSGAKDSVEDIDIVDAEYISELRELEGFTKNDVDNKRDVVRILGKDPFLGRPKPIQKILYEKLLPYLDEDTVEDSYKLDIIIQIVETIANVEMISRKLSSISTDIENNNSSSELKGLIEQIQALTKRQNDLAKENGISVLSRKDGGNNKNTIGYKMRLMRDLGIPSSVVDFYDQKTCDAMLQVAEISTRAIIDQVFLDENDWSNMVAEQRNLVIELQNKVDDLLEEVRLKSQEIRYKDSEIEKLKDIAFSGE